jgi:hypothetical protein
MTDSANRLLAELDRVVATHAGVAAQGVAVLDGENTIALAGFCGTSLAAPHAIMTMLRDAPPSALVLTNDPHAGGVGLDQVFVIGRVGPRSIVSALTFRDFGAMRKDVFKRRAETFHEGLAFSLLPVDWSGPDRDAVLKLIAANVRDGAASRDVFDRVARAVLSARSTIEGTALRAGATPPMPVAGRAEGRAAVAGANGVAVDAMLDGSEGGWRVTLGLDNQTAREMARCSASAIRSASVLGVADALGLPRTAPLGRLRVEHGNVAAVAPEAVGEGMPVAYACYRAAFDAARKLSVAAATLPRDEAAFLARG